MLSEVAVSLVVVELSTGVVVLSTGVVLLSTGVVVFSTFVGLSTVVELSLSPGLENRTSSIGYPRSMLFAKADA